MNVAPKELRKFGRLAARWWDPRGPLRSLHAINPLRVAFILQASGLRNKRVLDVGCGGGLLCEALARLGANVTGIDIGANLVEAARAHAIQEGLPITYRFVTAEDLAQDMPASYDVVVCMEVLEHIPRPISAVTACSRLLKPGGDAYFSTIDRSLKSSLFAILGAEYLLRLLPIGSHRYRDLIRPTELLDWANLCGLEHRRHASITFNLLHRRFRLVESLDVNYLMHFRKSST